MDPQQSATSLYAAMWQAQRTPWKLDERRPGQRRSTRRPTAARTGRRFRRNPGFADRHARQDRRLRRGEQSARRLRDRAGEGRRRLPFRTTRGATWHRVNGEMKLRQRAFYYMAIYVDPTNPEVAYAPEVDGVCQDRRTAARRCTPLDAAARRQSHRVDQSAQPEDSARRQRRRRDGLRRRRQDLEHASTISRPASSITSRSTISSRSTSTARSRTKARSKGRARPSDGGIGARRLAHGRAGREHLRRARTRRSPNVTYGSGYYSAFARLDRITGEPKNVSPWPRYMAGAIVGRDASIASAGRIPIFFSPADPHELFVAAQVVFTSDDRGQTWKIISPDLTRNDPSTEGPSGGPVDSTRPAPRRFPTSRRWRSRRSTRTSCGPARPTGWCT